MDYRFDDLFRKIKTIGNAIESFGMECVYFLLYRCMFDRRWRSHRYNGKSENESETKIININFQMENEMPIT